MHSPNTTSTTPAAPQVRTRGVHPVWVRITHWTNVLAVGLMVSSGWRVYNASPIWPFRFPSEWTLGGWLGGALQWHFAAMWLLVGNGVVYLSINLLSARFSRRFLPLTPRAVLADLQAAVRGRLSHADLHHYNALQRAAYIGIVADLALLVLSGLVLWKSVQFPLIRALMGGYDSARIVHFVAMSVLLAFVLGHVVMALSVPRTLLAMVRGR